MSSDDELLKVINGSGFPLQLALQQAIEKAGIGWKIAHTEHAWSNPTDGLSGFIDIVLQWPKSRDSLVIECKRVQNAAWLFLAQGGSLKPRKHCKVWATIIKSSGLHFFGWADLPLPLATPEAQYCCLRGQSSNDKNTFLERVAGELVSSTEALAREERDYHEEGSESCRLYINVIVTTAQLFFAEYDHSALQLADGSLTEAKFHRVPYVRVRKQFSMRPVALSSDDWQRGDDIDRRRENTVFVVEAAHLLTFLKELNMDDIEVRSIGA